MLYLGLDVHSKWFTLAGFDKGTGEMFHIKRTNNTADAIRTAFATLPSPRTGAMETGTNAIAMYRLLSPYFDQLVMVSPHHVWDRQHSKAPKTDYRDALGMAEKLAEGKLHSIYVPSDDLREWRTLGRARLQVTQDITRHTNRLYALARCWGYLDEKKFLTKGGRTWLDALALPAQAQQVLTESLTELNTLQQREDAYEQLIIGLVTDDPICQLLLTIPYVGPLTAFILRAEIGDIARFAHPHKLISYTGLTPRIFQSSERTHFGPLTKVGNAYLRYMAVLYAQNAVKGKRDTPFKRKFYRLCHVHDMNEIKVILARDFLTVVFAMWTHRTVWHDDPPRRAAQPASVA